MNLPRLPRPIRSRLCLLAVACCMALPVQAATQIRIAVADIGSGKTPAGGGLVDVLHGQRLLEQAFAKDDVEIQWVFIKGAGPLINEAFANGQVDIAYLGDLASIVGKSGGLDTRVVAAAARGVNHYLAVPPGAEIHSLEDLRGKHVGLFRGTAAQLSFINALRTANLSERDLKVVNLDFAASSAALAAGHIDATWGGNNALALKQRGLAELPVSTKQTEGNAGQLSGLVLATQAFIDQHPERLQRLLQVQSDAARWAAQNREAYIALQEQQSGYPQRLIREELGDQDLAELLSPALDPHFVANLERSASAAREAGLIRRPVDVGQWLAPEFLDRLRREARAVTAQP
jgi:sulfonate transport system substrate-binding protein